MTDNDIMKDVRCCADHYCQKCSLQGKPNFTNTLLSFAWNTMYDQKAEIERLRAEIKRLNAEVKEKTETIGFLKKQCTDWCDSFCKVKSEAIKEFAEKLKESAFDCDVSFGYGREHYEKAVAVVEIDNLVKEMMD